MSKKTPITHLLFLDFETDGFQETVRLINMYHVEYMRTNGKKSRKLEAVEKGHITSIDIADLLDECISRKITRGRVYAHNAGFDIRYLINELNRLQIKNIYRAHLNGSAFLWADVLIEYKGIRIELEIRDSFRLLPMSLAKVGQSFCPEFPKLEQPDFENAPIDELVPYCQRDCEIIYKSLLSFSQKVGIPLKKLPITTPSLAFRKLRELGEKTFDVKAISGLAQVYNEELRAGYYGGRIIIRENLKTSDVFDVVSLDITSSYPAQMSKYDYPTNDSPAELKPASLDDLPTTGRFMIDITIHNYTAKLPILPYRNKRKIVMYPRGTFRTMITDIELNFLLKRQSDEFETLKINRLFHFQDCKPWLKPFIDISYGMKREGDEMNKQSDGSGEALRTVGKLLMNSAYGKFAEKYTRDALLTNSDCDDDLAGFLTDDEPESHDRRNVAIAAMITAAGRVQLYDMIYYYGIENVIYCDTDSVKIVKSVYDNTPQHPLINDDLGGWKYEGLYTDFSVIAPKVYFGLHDGKPELKCKGVPSAKGKLAYVEEVHADGYKIANTFEYITKALRECKRVTAFLQLKATQFRTFHNTGKLGEKGTRSITSPENVTGMKYTENGYIYHSI